MKFFHTLHVMILNKYEYFQNMVAPPLNRQTQVVDSTHTQFTTNYYNSNSKYNTGH